MKNTLIKVLSFMMALTMIVGCFTAIATAADCTHANATETVVAPTCQDRGYTRHVCADCGYVWQDNYVAKSTEHTELVKKDATEATCTDPAYEESIVCKTCGTVVSAGEAVEGSKPLLHTFTQKVVAATCEQIGYTVWVCVNCGLTAEQCEAAELADKVEGNVNFLNPEQKDPRDEGTDEVEGLGYDDFYYAENNETAPHHVWSYEVVKAIEACQEGLVQRTCAACGTVEDIVIEAVHTGAGFDYTALAMQGKYCGKYVTGVRCTTCGAYYEGETSTVNGEIVKDEHDQPTTKLVKLVENKAAGHNWWNVEEAVEDTIKIVNPKDSTDFITSFTYAADGKDSQTINPVTNKGLMAIIGAMSKDTELQVDPTCDKEGYKVVFCTICGAVEKQTVETLEHDFLGSDKELNVVYAYDKEFDAKTVCTPAFRSYKYCEKCDHVELWATISEAVAHEIEVSVEASKAPNCEDAGETVSYCVVCQEWSDDAKDLIKTDDAYTYDKTPVALAKGDLDAVDYETEVVYYVDGKFYKSNSDDALVDNICESVVKTAAIGHDMSDWTAYTTDCTQVAPEAYNGIDNVAGGTVATGDLIGIHRLSFCQNEDCKYAQIQLKTNGKSLTHQWPDDAEKTGTDGMVLVAATCMEGAHYEWGCKTEGCAATEGININGTDDDGAKNAEAHVITIKKGLETVANNDARGTEFVVYHNNKNDTVADRGVIVEEPVVVSKTITEATCKVAGVYEIQCNCGAIITKTGLKVEHKWDTVYNKNGNSSRGDNGDTSFAYVAATCLKDGQSAGIICYDCGEIKVATTVLPKGNKPVTGKVAVGQENGKLVYNEEGVICAGHVNKTPLEHETYKTNGNCQTKSTSWVIYKCCGEKVVTEGALGGHDFTTNGTTSSLVDIELPTCYKAGNHEYRTCRVCGLVKIDFECGDVDPVTGLYSCGMTSEEHIIAIANNDYVIPALEHDFEPVPDDDSDEDTYPQNYVPKKEETCFENGYTEHYVCANENCDATYGKEVIPAHGDAHWVELAPALGIDGMPLQVVNGVAMATVTTCTEDSVPAGSYCSKCMKDWTAENWRLGEKTAENTKGWTDYAPFVEKADDTHGVETIVKVVNYYTYADYLADNGVPAYYIDAEDYLVLVDVDGNEINNKEDLVIIDCTKDAYIIVQCKDCDEARLDETRHYTAKEAHNISMNYTEVKANDNQLCLKDSYKYKTCINCLHVQDVVVTKAKVAHKYTDIKGDEYTIDLSCTKIANFDGAKCDICGYVVDATVPFDPNNNSGIFGNKLITVHKLAYGYQAPTCTEDGFQIISCADCEETLVNEELEAINPNHLLGTYCKNAKGELVPCNDAHHDTTCVLTCTKDEHTHDKVACYTLSCAETHEHEDACYTLSCTKEVHTHTMPGCYCGIAEHKDRHDKNYLREEYVKYVTEVGQVDATYTAPGYLEYVCKKCGETVKWYNDPVLTAPKLTIDVAEGTVAAAGDKLAVKVLVSGYEFKFNTLRFDIYTDNGLVLAAENVVIDYAFAAEDNVTATAKQNADCVSVSIVVPVDVATGAAKDVEITAEDAAFVTVYFDVLPTAAGAKVNYIDVTDALNIDLSKKMAKVETQPEKDALKAEFVATILEAKSKNLAKFATAIAGDCDNNGVLDANDSVAIMTAAYNKEANTVLDINNNGFVDLEDHVKFLNFYISDQTALDYLVLLGVDFNDYVAAYNNEVDLDKNGVKNDDDKAVIAFYLEEKLSGMSYDKLDDKAIESIIVEIVTSLTAKPE